MIKHVPYKRYIKTQGIKNHRWIGTPSGLIYLFIILLVTFGCYLIPPHKIEESPGISLWDCYNQKFNIIYYPSYNTWFCDCNEIYIEIVKYNYLFPNGFEDRYQYNHRFYKDTSSVRNISFWFDRFMYAEKLWKLYIQDSVITESFHYLPYKEAI